MNKNREFFLANPRLGMLIKTYDKMSDEKKNNLEKTRTEWESPQYHFLGLKEG